MKLLVDLQGAQTSGSRSRGIGRYTRALARALINENKHLEEICLGWNTLLPSPLPDMAGLCFGEALYSAPYGALKRKSFANELHDVHQDVNDCLLRHHIGINRCDHVLFSSLMEMDDNNFVLPKNLNFGPLTTSYSIVYDIIPHLFQDQYLRSENFRRRYEQHLFVKTSADVLFSISELTKNDLVRTLGIDPDRIVTIGAGIDPEAFQTKKTSRQTFCDKYGLLKPFLFFMGGDEYRKNIDGLVAALCRLPASRKQALQLLITGTISPEKATQLRLAAQDAELPADALVFVKHLSEGDLLQAYNACAATVIPSLYEGFGLPVLEAMACNATVIANGKSCMAEILTEQAFLFDANDPADIAARIEFVLSHPEATHAFKQTYADTLAKYSWQNVANRVLEVFAERDRLRSETLHRAAKVMRPSDPLNIVVLGKIHTDWQAAIVRLAESHILSVYTTPRDMPQLDALPVSLGWVSNLASSTAKASPVFTIIGDCEGLLAFLNIQHMPDQVVVLDQSLLDALAAVGMPSSAIGQALKANHRQIVHKLAEAGALWLYDAGTLMRRDASHYPFSEEAFKWHPNKTVDGQDTIVQAIRAITEFIAAETRFYQHGRSYVFARALKTILQKHGKLRPFSKTVSQLASISVFEKCRLTD